MKRTKKRWSNIRPSNYHVISFKGFQLKALSVLIESLIGLILQFQTDYSGLKFGVKNISPLWYTTQQIRLFKKVL